MINNRHSSQSGFALGLILLVIVLMAIVTVAISQSSVNFSNTLDRDKASGYATLVKSQGVMLRSVFQQMLLSGKVASTIDRKAVCTDIESNCLSAKIKMNGIPKETFVAANYVYGYDSWSYDGSAVFANNTLDVFFLNSAIKPEVCQAIESANKSRNVSLAELATLTGSKTVAGAAFDLVFTFNIQSIDGCYRDSSDNQYYYYVVAGKSWT